MSIRRNSSHSQKDAPSGTAISIAEGIIENSKYEAWKLDETKVKN
jgi:4-hydroxy-tetrahydrodipicolinate reductase